MDPLVSRVVLGYLSSRVATQFGTPLYGHDSMNDAYVVEDYPYGFKLRTTIRYWLEFAPNKGWRFVSQTMDPKRAPGSWNKPKASTYALLGACMYLDHQDHVTWAALSPYTEAGPALEFVKAFPKADFRYLSIYAKKKVVYLEALISGKAQITINGVPKERSESENARTQAELEQWAEIVKLL